MSIPEASPELDTLLQAIVQTVTGQPTQDKSYDEMTAMLVQMWQDTEEYRPPAE
jgi:hypothetical protein